MCEFSKIWCFLIQIFHKNNNDIPVCEHRGDIKILLFFL